MASALNSTKFAFNLIFPPYLSARQHVCAFEAVFGAATKSQLAKGIIYKLHKLHKCKTLPVVRHEGLFVIFGRLRDEDSYRLPRFSPLTFKIN